jgi:CheY-like chemotaxis protein
MDINLPDINGHEAASMMRNIEKELSNKRTNIIAVSVDGKFVHDRKIFDDYCNCLFINCLVEKPIKKENFNNYISKHIELNRPDLKLREDLGHSL